MKMHEPLPEVDEGDRRFFTLLNGGRHYHRAETTSEAVSEVQTGRGIPTTTTRVVDIYQEETIRPVAESVGVNWRRF